ncbi:hypothetical protein chiPu_0029858, partial [Chiloscyllium punctatum]|nr:hypothetical protein [Chiloscyllium punctatum]
MAVVCRAPGAGRRQRIRDFDGLCRRGSHCAGNRVLRGRSQCEVRDRMLTAPVVRRQRQSAGNLRCAQSDVAAPERGAIAGRDRLISRQPFDVQTDAVVGIGRRH